MNVWAIEVNLVSSCVGEVCWDVGVRFGVGLSVTEMQVSSTKASNERLMCVDEDGEWSVDPGVWELAIALKIISIFRIQMIGDAPLPCPQP